MKKIFVLLSCVLLLAACGGGGSSGSGGGSSSSSDVSSTASTNSAGTSTTPAPTAPTPTPTPTTNTAPVANAGTAQSVSTGSVVTLNGSGSSDSNKDALTYKWSFTSKPAGSNAALSSTTAIRPTFTADVAGSYVLSLVVNDGKVDSSAATVTITAIAASPFVVKYSVEDSGTSTSTCFFTGTIGIGQYSYNFSNCLMYANAGSPLVASIYNNTDKTYNIISLKIDFASGTDYTVNVTDPVLLPHSGLKWTVVMPNNNELTQSKAIFNLSGIGDVSGNFALVAIP